MLSLRSLRDLWPIKLGASRLVFCIPSVIAIKVPRLKRLAEGLRSNRQEIEWSAKGIPELCPVLISFIRGYFVVMAWARPLTDAEWTKHMEDPFAFGYDYHPGLPIELVKPENFGMYKERQVAIDYGLPS